MKENWSDASLWTQQGAELRPDRQDRRNGVRFTSLHWRRRLERSPSPIPQLPHDPPQAQQVVAVVGGDAAQFLGAAAAQVLEPGAGGLAAGEVVVAQDAEQFVKKTS